jgi:DNA-binding response OmpR family regulator
VGSDQPVVVVIEDDPNIADLVDMYLRSDGFRVYLASDAEVGLDRIATHSPCLVIIDVGLPGPLDGLDVCRRLRAAGEVPIIMLTARDGEIDRVLGLEMGADDYVTKPFSPRELVARVRAILRRTQQAERLPTAAVEIGPITVDPGGRQTLLRGRPVALTAREFDLLHYFADNRHLALSRAQILDAVWGPGWVGDERTVDVHVRQLRKKLGEDLPLDTVWGVGYRLG